MKRRSSWIWTVLILLGGIALLGGILYGLTSYEPEFYSAGATPGEYETTELSAKLITRVQDLKNDIRSKPDWGGSLSETDLNCFFRANLGETGSLTDMLPTGFHSPRIRIVGDTIQLGLRYGSGTFTSIIWVEVRAWLVKDEMNLIALELRGLKAGALPLGCQSLLDQITDLAQESNIEVTWYRHEGNPVGMFRFYADQLRPTTQIHTFRIRDGQIAMAGRTRLENAPALAPSLTPIRSLGSESPAGVPVPPVVRP
ncbi:MAG: hypothetical protein ACRCZF_02830 [Gemmataceae bacterium]